MRYGLLYNELSEVFAMDNGKMGRFISELRKSQQMTQKDLAARLNVTDKAISKWERGLSCPDISLLAPLSDILCVTIDELLNGDRSSAEAVNPQTIVVNALQYADKAVKSKAKLIQNICAAVFSGLILAGIVVCAIVDAAISGALTWSLIPISSSVFSWLVFMPIIKYDIKGIVPSLIIVSVFIVPFLLILSSLIDSGGLLIPIGVRMSAISVLYLWSVFVIFKILWSRKLIAAAASLL